MSFDIERTCKIEFQTKMEHFPTVKPEHVYIYCFVAIIVP